MAVNAVTNLNLGKALQIAYSEGIKQQLSTEFAEFDMIMQRRGKKTAARSYNFAVMTTLNPRSVGVLNVGTSNNPLPVGHQPTMAEGSAVFKQYAATTTIEMDLWKRAMESPEKYFEPFAASLESTQHSLKRRIAADVHQDGTGVLGTVASTAVSGGMLVVTLSTSDTARGFVSWNERDDKVRVYDDTGVTSQAPTVSSGTFSYFVTYDVDRAAGTVTLQAFDSSDTALTVTAANAVGAGDLIYRFNQPSRPNLSATVTADYGTLTDNMVGFEGLFGPIPGSSRIVHGLTYGSGVRVTNTSAGGASLDANSHLHACLDSLFINVGSSYQWSRAVASPEAIKTLIDSRETDRRFVSVDDKTRGASGFAYKHPTGGEVSLYATEFCRKDRIWLLPEAKGDGKKVIEFLTTDFEPIDIGYGVNHLGHSTSANTHVSAIRQYMLGHGVLISNHPVAVGVIHAFV